MFKSRVLIYSATGFASGILLASRFYFPEILAWAVLVLAIMMLLWIWPHKRAILALLFFACAALGVLRLGSTVRDNEFANLQSKQQLRGIITEDIDLRVDKQLITFQPDGFHQKIIITASKYKNYFYGDRIVVMGKVTEPKSSPDFDYAAYLQRYNIYGQMYFPVIYVLRANQANKVLYALLQIKYAFIRQTEKVLPQVESNLLLGILLGARKALPQNVVDDFTATGVSHVIAISGYNITIIVVALGFLRQIIGRRWALMLTLAVIAAFVGMSGGSASVIRAAIMGGVVLMAANVGRQYSVTPALCLSAAGMLLINPRILYWDASFQLSFAATCGVVYGLPVLEQLTAKWPALFGIKSILLTTFAAIIATLPLILLLFSRLSLIAPLVNILILPLVPITMLFGFLTGLPIISPGCGIISHWLLKYMLWVTHFFARLPFASLPLTINQYIFLALYGVIITGYFLLRRAVQKRNSLV